MFTDCLKMTKIHNLMEVTYGTHGLWEVWIIFTEEEILFYKKEGNKGLEKTAN